MKGDEFRAVLKQLGLTHQKAAERWGYSVAQISLYARGVSKIPHKIEHVVRIELGEVEPLIAQRRREVA